MVGVHILFVCTPTELIFLSRIKRKMQLLLLYAVINAINTVMEIKVRGLAQGEDKDEAGEDHS